MADFGNLDVVIGLLTEIKGLIKSQDPLIPMYAALGGALIGAGIPIAGKFFSDWRERVRSRKAVASQLFAEITAILDIVSTRKYLEFVSGIVQQITPTNGVGTLQIQVSDDVMIIYRANLDNLHLLDRDVQVKVVKFYRYLSALIEDVKPGGLFNDPKYGLTVDGGNQFLSIAYELVDLGNELVAVLGKASERK